MRFRDTVILFSKAARICRVKTRLYPALSHRECLYFHRRSAEYLYQQIQSSTFNVKIYTTNRFRRVTSLLPEDIMLQQGIDLGARMYHAMSHELKFADRVAVIGSDCIEINQAYIKDSFDLLQNPKDLVLGQANDGGYILLAARKVSRALFRNTRWGSSEVLQTTSSNARALGYNVKLMPTLVDVDNIHDLHQMMQKNNVPDWMKPLVKNK